MLTGSDPGWRLRVMHYPPAVSVAGQLTVVLYIVNVYVQNCRSVKYKVFSWGLLHSRTYSRSSSQTPHDPSLTTSVSTTLQSTTTLGCWINYDNEAGRRRRRWVEFSAELTLIGSLIFISGSRPHATAWSRPWYTSSKLEKKTNAIKRRK